MHSLRAKRFAVIVGAIFLSVISLYIVIQSRAQHQGRLQPWKLYWFVPDGLRADPEVFDVYRWAREGKLPNFRRMMEEGSFGYSIPVFPSHTPVNFATLFTGVAPLRHGVADGPIRVQGYPLNIVAQTGFSSVAKSIDPLWFTLEQAGKMVSLLSVPGSTPPEISNGHVVKGRWGGWGIEFPNAMFHAQSDESFRELLGWNDKVFQIGKKLTEFIPSSEPSTWSAELPKSFSPPREINLKTWESDLFALLIDTSDDHQVNYDSAVFSLDKRNILFTLAEGQWSEWFDLSLVYRLQRNYQEHVPQRLELEQELSRLTFPTKARVKVVKLGAPNFFRIRVLYDGLNESLSMPQSLAGELRQAAGPMVDFVDNFPPQLVYFQEDKETFLEESEMSFIWHKRAQQFFFDHVNQDVFIHSIYSPNQMLTSRWWMGAVDPAAKAYATVPVPEREQALDEVIAMYQKVDEMVGEALDRRNPDSFVVVSSDHGVAPLDYEVKLNNLFAKKGWLRFYQDKTSGELQIDWTRTKVVFLNMNHIFLKPEGLAGEYRPSQGTAYRKLQEEVILALKELRSENGLSPLAGLQTREEAAAWGLPAERVGDLVIANRAGYGWIEDVSKDLEVFSTSLKAGYKQGILPEHAKALWTPFLIVGPGIKAGYQLARPIHHVEQYPTVMRALKIKTTYDPDGKPLEQIFAGDSDAEK